MKFVWQLGEHIALFQALHPQAGMVEYAGDLMATSLKMGGKVFFCGNGGSAAAAQHMAAELTGRFVKDRRPLAGIALTTDTSAITAIANDYDYSQIFARQLEALACERDCLVLFSTSGNSPNVIEAARAARGKGMVIVGLLGRDGGKVLGLCLAPILVPSDSTARIQEAHEFIGHALCAHIEAALGL